MRDALVSYEGIGAQLYAPELHGLLAAGLGASGRIDEAAQRPPMSDFCSNSTTWQPALVSS